MQQDQQRPRPTPAPDSAEAERQLRAERERGREWEIKCLELQKKVEVLSNQLNNERALLKEQERKNADLEGEVVGLKNDLKIGRQQAEAHSLAQQGARESLELEIQTLKTQVAAGQRRENELFSKAMSLESELQDKSAKAHNLSLQNTQLQTNNNNLLQMLETYEAKVNAQNKKLKQLEQQAREAHEDTLAARKDAEMVEWKLSEKEKELERKDAEARKEKERIAKMWEERFAAMQKALAEQAYPH